MVSVLVLLGKSSVSVNAQARRSPSPTIGASATPVATATASPIVETPRPDVTQTTQENVGPLERLLAQNPVSRLTPFNIIQYAIRIAVERGVPANTIVLLLLLPIVTAVVAAARHVVGLQGFGILLPSALAITFLAIGPVVGIGIFLSIIGSSTVGRVILRKLKLRLHYLPRMSLLLAFTTLALLGILVIGSYVNVSGITNISIFPVLFLVLLSEDFIRVQLGKSLRTAFNITTQTLLLAFISYMFLTLQNLQRWALLNPELLMGGVILFDIVLGKFSGLRVLEYYRFRKLIKTK